MSLLRPLMLAAALCWVTPCPTEAGAPGTFQVRRFPLGVSEDLYDRAVPPKKRPTAELSALGEKLFRDQRLSRDGSVACATCHIPERGFVSPTPHSFGIGHQEGRRNAPTVLNALFHGTQFWDGRAVTLEEQARGPLLSSLEMGQRTPEDVASAVGRIAEYSAAFEALNHRPVAFADVVGALAAFERGLVSGNSPFDRFAAGDSHALDASARRGWELFNTRAGCVECHSGRTLAPLFVDQKSHFFGKGTCAQCHFGNLVSPTFQDQRFHNTGVAAKDHDLTRLLGVVKRSPPSGPAGLDLALGTEASELGRYLVSGQTEDIGAFKTPTLRNVMVTGPYFHDGSAGTLWDVVRHYNRGGVAHPFQDVRMRPLGLSEGELDDLVAFLAALTDDRYAALGLAELRRQAAAARKP